MSISCLLEESFLSNRENILIKENDISLSYQECDRLSRVFSQKILDVNPSEQLVGILMEKGWEQVIAVLSIIRAGKAFLPLNINDSEDQVRELLRAGEVNVVLTNKSTPFNLGKEIHQIVVDFSPLTIASDCKKITAKNPLLYVIFTSGSTGTPKGVMINEESVLNTLLDINKRFLVKSSDKIIYLSQLNFDLAVYDILGAALAGASIVIPRAESVYDLNVLCELIIKEKISVWNSTPASMQLLVDYIEKIGERGESRHQFLSLRLVLLSGDWIPVSLPSKIKKIFRNAKVISLGGATEASIWSILYEIEKIDHSWKSIPYGKPLSNQYFYILDSDLNSVQGNESGQLYIGGVGVSSGYWRDPKNTVLSFVNHPTYGRLYRTGDLGRYMVDGNIEFLGRMDSQVKINGYRVELSAIESVLLSLKYIEQAVVTAINKEDDYRELVAYVKVAVADFEIEKNTESILSDWNSIFDTLVKKNTDGWVSSYTGIPFTSSQMDEWINNTVTTILELNPRKVCEIGCGTGLIFSKIAHAIDEYHGIDFSKEEIKHIEIMASSLDVKTKFYNMTADSVDQIKEQFDTVIINSVIQYFPDKKYLLDVVNKAIALTKSGGNIYIGDVRNLVNINYHYLRYLLHGISNNLSREKLQYELYRCEQYERELLVHPLFFLRGNKFNKRISDVDIKIKGGISDTEMNCFRYDVVLKIDSPCEATAFQDPPRLTWDENCNVPKICKKLLLEEPNTLIVSGIPNQRTLWLQRLLEDLIVGNLSEVSNQVAEQYYKDALLSSVEPSELGRIAQEYGYKLSLTMDGDFSMNTLAAVFTKQDGAQTTSGCQYGKHRLSPETRLSNNPLKNRFISNLIASTREELKKKLSHYMIPSRIIAIDDLPLTSNGKVDRKNLPYIEAFGEMDSSKKNHVKNIDKLEVAAFISEILKERVDLDKTFRENGGTSIEAVNLAAELYNKFKLKVEVCDLLSPNKKLMDIVDLVLEESV